MTKLAHEADIKLKPAMIALIERRYDAIVAKGLAVDVRKVVGAWWSAWPRPVEPSSWLTLAMAAQDRPPT